MPAPSKAGPASCALPSKTRNRAAPPAKLPQPTRRMSRSAFIGRGFYQTPPRAARRSGGASSVPAPAASSRAGNAIASQRHPCGNASRIARRFAAMRRSVSAGAEFRRRPVPPGRAAAVAGLSPGIRRLSVSLRLLDFHAEEAARRVRRAPASAERLLALDRVDAPSPRSGVHDTTGDPPSMLILSAKRSSAVGGGAAAPAWRGRGVDDIDDADDIDEPRRKGQRRGVRPNRRRRAAEVCRRRRFRRFIEGCGSLKPSEPRSRRGGLGDCERTSPAKETAL